MAKKPLITVIIPVFNGMPFLRETIDSIRNQTLTDIEILIANDGSRDSSLSYLESLNDKRIHILNHNRKGLCETLNIAINSAQAELIARTDQDDISLPKRLQKQLEFISTHKEIDCIFTRIIKFNNLRVFRDIDKGLLKKHSYEIFDPWVHGNMLQSTMFAKKEILMDIGGYRKPFYPADDWDLVLRIHESYKIAILNDALVKYRYHSSANTLKYFSIMEERRRWAEDCHLRRKAGIRELEYDEYKKIADRNFYRVINRKRKDLSKLLIRKAGTECMNRNYLLLALYIILVYPLVPIKLSKRCFWFCFNSVVLCFQKLSYAKHISFPASTESHKSQ